MANDQTNLLIRDIAKLRKAMPLAGRSAMSKAGFFLKNKVQQKWRDDRGFSKRRIVNKTTKIGNQWTARVGFLDNNVKYARSVEYGQKPKAVRNKTGERKQSITEWLGGKKDLQRGILSKMFKNKKKKQTQLIKRSDSFDTLKAYQKSIVYVILKTLYDKGTIKDRGYKGQDAFLRTERENFDEAYAIYAQEFKRQLP